MEEPCLLIKFQTEEGIHCTENKDFPPEICDQKLLKEKPTLLKAKTKQTKKLLLYYYFLHVIGYAFFFIFIKSKHNYISTEYNI